MAKHLLIGLGSGVASALLYASLVSASFLSIVLFYLAPLPILIATMGWGRVAGALAVATAALGLALSLDLTLGLVHAIAVGLPAWWLGVRGARAATHGGGPSIELGQVVLWAALLGAVIVAASVPLLSESLAGYKAALRAAVERLLQVETGAAPGQTPRLPGGADAGPITELLVLVLPPLAALLWTVTTLLNVWIAGRIVQRSGRLVRRWPDIAAELAFPAGTPTLLGLFLLLALLPGYWGFLGELLATTFIAAFAVLGLTVVHFGTRGLPPRYAILAATYLFIVFQTWPLLLLALLGLAEQGLGLRARIAARRIRFTPPTPPKS